MPQRKQQSLVPIRQAEPVRRAAAYVRMSTEHQKYSTDHQLSAIRAYAAEHGFTITRVYADEGISGLNIEKRTGLKTLLDEARRGAADYCAVLVYDVSRWGRLQDIDQSAFYEYLCRGNGVDVLYCAETFPNDQKPISAIIKAVRRAEAADYSRDLSNKVSNGQCNLARRGYSQGAPPRYGLKHVLVRDDGRPFKDFRRRTKGKLHGCHVELAPGPKAEVRVVKDVFRQYLKLGRTVSQIARNLNSRGHRTRQGCLWNASTVRIRF